MLGGKGFPYEYTLNYEYKQMDNIAIFYIKINKKWVSVSVSIPFLSSFQLSRNTL